jgi:hypothetical protein
MSNILLQSTIADSPDGWDITRFSLLAAELRAGGHRVTVRNRADDGAQDPILVELDLLDFDQLWLIAVDGDDGGDGLTAAEAYAVRKFRENGGGILTARGHHDVGRSLTKLGSIGRVNKFHDDAGDPAARRGGEDSPYISWPNFHSGADGDYQPVLAAEPFHELLRTTRSPIGRIEWFPAHPLEGSVHAEGPYALALAQGRSTETGYRFNLAVLLDGELTQDGRPMGRALAESSFHHFADYNWDLGRSAPTSVTEAPGVGVGCDPSRLFVFKAYVHNIATWLHPAVGDR